MPQGLKTQGTKFSHLVWGRISQGFLKEVVPGWTFGESQWEGGPTGAHSSLRGHSPSRQHSPGDAGPAESEAAVARGFGVCILPGR